MSDPPPNASDEPLAIPLGPFDVIEPIGEGGMAVVWRGVHRIQGVPVAIKFVTGPWAQNPMFLEMFQNETRAIAGVDHPGIAMVYDHGEVPEASAIASEGALRQGTPYIVMELARGGAMDDIEVPLDWPDLKGVLLTLLDALGHAHARGIIHRDLKPANVLLCLWDDLRPGLKLTDFGIAHATKRESRSERDELTEGTPEYMAPEQCRAQWRDYGPWTDLYALGCLAYELASGAPPFVDNSATMVFIHQIDSQPARLDMAALGLPPEFEGWLWRLLQKDPADRFQTCADAAWALERIGPEELPPGELLSSLGVQSERRSGAKAGSPAQPRQTLLGAAPQSPAQGQRPRPTAAPSAPAGAAQQVDGITLAARKAPPLPDTWQRPADDQWSMALVGAGLGLYGLRALRLVDREAPRDAMWETLRKTRQLGRAHLFMLHGAAGNGKSALARWMCQRAAEVGGANILVGYHSQRPGSGDGVSRMVQQYLQCVGLTRAEMLERIEFKLRQQGVTDPYEWNALTEFITPALDQDYADGAQRIRFGSREEGYALVRRLLNRISRDRPTIVWLDDVHWSKDSVAFARYIMENQAAEPVPALLLCTSRDEALIELPDMHAELQSLTKLRGARDMPIDVLEKRDRAALVRQLLGLEGRLAQMVEERTEGNPLFAVQLVGDWVQRGVLEVGTRGFVLRKGAEAILPNDLYQFWTARIERLLDGKQDLEPALQMAAVLSREVIAKEWIAACEQASVPVDVDVLGQLFRERLAAPLEDGNWSFTHGVLRETFERRARESGRWSEYHRACVRMLRGEYSPGVPSVQERIGRHLFDAGDYEEALEPLVAAAGARRVAGEYVDAHQLLDLRDEAMSRAELPESDERWGQSWVLKSWVSSNQGRIADAWTHSERAERAARHHRWRTTLPPALLGMAVAARERGDLAKADTLTDEAFFLYEELKNQIGMAHCLQGSGVVARLRGDMDWSETQVIRALNLHERVGNTFGVAQCKQRLGEAVLRAGRAGEARKWLGEAAAEYEAISAPLGRALCDNGLGDVARMSGDIATASASYRAAKKALTQIGSSSLAYTTERLGLIALTRGKYRRANELLRTAREAFIAVERAGDAWRLSAELLPCVAAFQDWEGWDEYAQDLEHLTGDVCHVDPDIATCAGWAGKLAANASQVERARAAYRLEAGQWRALRRNTLASKAEAALAELGA